MDTGGGKDKKNGKESTGHSRRDRVFRVLGFLGFIGEGARHRPGGFFGTVFAATAVALSLYELWLGAVGQHDPIQYSIIFLTGALTVIFLTTTSSKRSTKLSALDVVLAVAAFTTGIYLLVHVQRYLNWVQGLTTPTATETIFGCILVALVVEASRRSVGWGLTSVVLVLVAYTFTGHLLGGVFSHAPVPLSYFLEQQAFSTNGIFGIPVQVAATYAFLFVLFGTLFHKAGGGQFFFDLAAALTGRMIGGPAKACVVSSALYGSISGSPTADVATTGQVNIPLMKRLGYGGTFAGATEAAASTGGALLPPVMGSVAFLMVEFTGIPYARIVQATILTAVLYYFGIFLQVHHRTKKWGMGALPADQLVGLWKAIKSGWPYLIPISVLIYFLIRGYTPSTIAVTAIAATIVVSWFRKSTRIGPRGLVDAFTTTVYMITGLAAAVAAAGLVIGAISLTGLAGKFTYLIFSVTGGYLVPGLIVAMVVTIIFGMGMPTPAVYVMAVALVAPPLRDMGLSVLEANMFLLYFAAMSAITPPIAVAAFTAAPIAQANPMAIGRQAVRLAAVGFIFPYIFVFRPGLLMVGSSLEILDAFLAGVFAAVALATAVEGWFGRGPLNWLERTLLLSLAIGIVYPSPISTLVGAAAVVAALAYKYRYPRDAAKLEGQSTAGGRPLAATSRKEPVVRQD